MKQSSLSALFKGSIEKVEVEEEKKRPVGRPKKPPRPEVETSDELAAELRALKKRRPCGELCNLGKSS